MIKLSKEMLYVGIAVLVLGQLLNYFGASMGSILPFSILLNIIHISAFAFELVLLHSILKQIQNDDSYTFWFVLQFVTHVGIISLYMWASNFSVASFTENRTFIVIVPSAVSLILHVVVGLKFFLLKDKLAIWFKVYAGLFLSQALGSVLSTGFLYSDNSFLELYLVVSKGMNLVVSLSLALIFFQAIQELDKDTAPTLSDDILDIS